MASSSLQSPQQVQQFLTNALSPRNSLSLPYTEDQKWLIRQHLLSLISAYSTLELKTSSFTHNDGNTVSLLQANGTIPMLYQNITYNIPITIWLMETYPVQPPCVYVVPSRDMFIKHSHPCVDPSGLVSTPYQHIWDCPRSNLVDLVHNLSHLFALDPPLYTRQNPNPSPSISSRVYGGRLPSSRQKQSEGDQMDVYRKKTINTVLERLNSDIGVLRKIREEEMEELFDVQAVLRQRGEQISKGLREMQEEREGLELKLQMVLMNTDVCEIWLRENEGKTKGIVAVDEVFLPFNDLSKQILECSSSDLAIEDLIYSLDKAVQEGAIPFDQYLKNIRSISREQFFHRAKFAKVRSAQMQAQIASMASRAT